MINFDNYKKFVYHNYQPTNIKKIIETILIVWLLSFLMIFINNIIIIDYLLIFINLVMTVFYFVLSLKEKKSIVYSFIFDGVSSMHLAIIFNLFAYILLNLSIKLKPSFIIIFLSLLIISGLIFSIVIFFNIKHNYYSNRKSAVTTGTAIFTSAGIMGILFSRFFLKNAPEDIMLLIIAVCFLLISIVFTAGISYFIKIYTYQKIRRKNENSQDEGSQSGDG